MLKELNVFSLFVSVKTVSFKFEAFIKIRDDNKKIIEDQLHRFGEYVGIRKVGGVAEDGRNRDLRWLSRVERKEGLLKWRSCFQNND